ncbi:MAG: MarR family transcriptional regulator [Nocardioidaceae bacterium]|nr:MarR family transcriptional regulator [Nocardioidaceae bacterium]
MSGAMIHAGLARVPALVFAALLEDEDGRMTAGELAARLQVSSGSVSQAVNYLEQVQMLRRERDPGSRRDVYVLEDETWHTALTKRDAVYAPIIAALDAGLAGLPDGTDAHRRMLVTREFFAFVNAELSALAAKWEERRKRL